MAPFKNPENKTNFYCISKIANLIAGYFIPFLMFFEPFSVFR